MTWAPPNPVSLPTMTDAEMSRARTRELDDLARILNITVRTTPPLVQWTLPDEQAIPVSACLREQGWDASVGPGGVLRIQVEESQKSAVRVLQYECTAKYSIDPRYLQPTPEMYGAVWHYFHEYGIPCLASFSITPDEDLPTKERFIATRGRYFLYPRDVTVPDPVQRACPQLPPTRAMFQQK